MAREHLRQLHESRRAVCQPDRALRPAGDADGRRAGAAGGDLAPGHRPRRLLGRGRHPVRCRRRQGPHQRTARRRGGSVHRPGLELRADGLRVHARDRRDGATVQAPPGEQVQRAGARDPPPRAQSAHRRVGRRAGQLSYGGRSAQARELVLRRGVQELRGHHVAHRHLGGGGPPEVRPQEAMEEGRDRLLAGRRRRAARGRRAAAHLLHRRLLGGVGVDGGGAHAVGGRRRVRVHPRAGRKLLRALPDLARRRRRARPPSGHAGRSEERAGAGPRRPRRKRRLGMGDRRTSAERHCRARACGCRRHWQRGGSGRRG
mmetsp:Transcript_107566/g.314502  ORF Transcript_107566/g.314502 Transcript_107566/m.314502 type:complete len:317 (-) Transcript_107566:564-1514(-)